MPKVATSSRAVWTSSCLSRSEPPANPTEVHAPAVLLTVGITEDDQIALRHSLPENWQIVATDSSCAAREQMRRRQVAIVLCESNLPDGSWHDVLNDTESCSEKPPVIVASRSADEHLWAEVLNLGGFDVIATPFQSTELRHVLQTAFLQA